MSDHHYRNEKGMDDFPFPGWHCQPPLARLLSPLDRYRPAGPDHALVGDRRD